ncbi:hypothetical protein [Methanocella conradii]|uniref:hypothetical protein n=1 Tax=Methanocella conradii TaxID=1175444 RepID=UPI0024B36877|nr:hypothetical protein [Methanocella conradii]MDI6896624.1 hypothetical protein [Methanocella conradii]
MEARYVQAIKAGVIGGVVIGLLTIMNLLIAVTVSWTDISILSLVNCCIFIIIAVLMVCVGALGVRMAAPMIATLNDALLVAAVAGAVAGIIAAIIYFLTQVVSPWISNSYYYSSYWGSHYGYSPAIQSALGAFIAICCCGPALLLIAIMLSVIGGAIYAVAVLKVS